jgi:hypothetical protein
MSEINPKLKKIIIGKLEEDLGHKRVVPLGRQLWVLDDETHEWYINVTCNGLMEYNSKFFLLYSRLFSLDLKSLSKLLREWFESKFEIRINSSQRRTSDLNYIVENVVKPKKDEKWRHDNRFGFSYDVVKKFVKLEQINKIVEVRDFIIYQ